jgi:hypothetical protein
MENAVMVEDFLPLIAYAAALAAVIWLGRKPPDYVQLAFLTVVGCGVALYAAADVMGLLNGGKRVWELRAIGSSILFFGLMIYLLRQLWLKTDICRSLK